MRYPWWFSSCIFSLVFSLFPLLKYRYIYNLLFPYQTLSNITPYEPHRLPSLAHGNFLHNYVSFYRGLSEKGKKKFRRRVDKFIAGKDFEFFFDPGKERLLVKTLIAASCIQLTWGIKDPYIHAYNYIGVYEDGLQLKRSGGDVYSAVWLTKYIRFSWNKIKEGFIITDDNKHIGLYEWTRALIIQAKKDNILDDFFSAYYNVWCETARDVMFVVDEDEHVPLDQFGQKLPVIIQHFFESPQDLKDFHPEIYEQTRILLNLDLLEAQEYDYIYSKKLAKEKKIRSKNRAMIFGVQDKVRKFGLSSGIMYYILVQFPLIAGIWYLLGRWTYYSPVFYLFFFLLLGAGSFLIYRNYYKKRGLSVKASFILGVLGLVPCLYGSMTLLNYYTPVKEKATKVAVYKPEMLDIYLPWKGFTEPHITRVEIIDKYNNASDTTAGLSNTFDAMAKIYTQDIDHKSIIYLIDSDDDVILHTHTGIFGADVYEGYEVIIRK